MSGGEDAAGTPAPEIAVTLFREILLVPLALVPGTLGPRKTPMPGRMLTEMAADRLLAGGRWQEQDDRLQHLRAERAAATNAAGRPAALTPAYEEFVFFEPYVQRFLYGNRQGAGDDRRRRPIRLFSRDDVRELEIRLRPKEQPVDSQPAVTSGAGAAPLCFWFNVNRCNLYLFDTGNAVLTVEIELNRRRHAAGVNLSHVQRLLESVRRVFPPYFSAADDARRTLQAPYFPVGFGWRFAGGVNGTVHPAPSAEMLEQVFGGGTDTAWRSRHPPMSQPWRDLLKPLLVKGDASAAGTDLPEVLLSQMGDDRAFVLAQVGVPDPARIARNDWVRLCFADEPGEGYPYGRGFLSKFERVHCYDRFWDDDPADWKKLRYLCCGYALVAVGADTRGPETSFFRETLSKHIQRHYFQLVLISCFQKAALLTLSERLADTLDSQKDDARAFRASVHRIAEDIQHFTHRYWFEDISAQLQGQELFEMLRRNLRTRELYQQVAAELAEADQFLAAEEQADMTRQQARLNVIASVGLALAVVVGIFGMNIFRPGAELLPGANWWQLAFALAGVGAAFWLIDELSRHTRLAFVRRWAPPVMLAAVALAYAVDRWLP